MAAFKDAFSPESVGELADALHQAWPEFPRRRLEADIAEAFEPRSLSERSDLVVERLAHTLPQPFPAGAEVVWRLLDVTELDGWIVMPVAGWVARAGLDDPERALPLLAGLTPRFSSEFAIRPFIEHRPDITFGHLHRWVADPDEHVRRLVSEGTRPRLPWGTRLRGLVADPTPAIALLERLHDDPSPYVRRSVANHLNDITKDHPALALECARRWATGGSVGSQWVVRHGLRTMVKKGDPDALALMGIDTRAEVRLRSLSVEPDRVRIGEAVSFTATLELVGADATEVVVDYRVHYVGSTGTVKAPKVFKLTRRRLQPGVPLTLTRRHAFAPVSIRTIHPGGHTIDLQVNGTVLGSVSVEVDPG
jgi:3-methyladenine DNA glycosylase AlkC